MSEDEPRKDREVSATCPRCQGVGRIMLTIPDIRVGDRVVARSGTIGSVVNVMGGIAWVFQGQGLPQVGVSLEQLRRLDP